GIDHVFQVGGAQAVAAMAVGTDAIPKVSKIFGPGNQYVTAAKENAQKYGVAIDMPAGPSEVLVYADETCMPDYVAADLLSQAEHGVDSQVVAVVSTIEIADAINKALAIQLEELPRKEIAKKALENSHIIIEPDVTTAFQYINIYGPEHFIIASDRADELADLTINAGSVFLGNLCPEAVGDYASGTNHTLPTYGWAKSYSGVNIDTFMRKITFQKLNQQGMEHLGPIVVTMAEAEQLQAHANAVKIRLKDL
ncbi:MAG TPA: histidinol dehydrogenase, partial [Saprospiraceae bacterium]|nr:histidinol dehydrogenase [Saprospiraceae bacterium]